MSAKRTLERILRDEDDSSGQTIRQWKLARDGVFIQIAHSDHSDWILIRIEDVEQFVDDLREIAAPDE